MSLTPQQAGALVDAAAAAIGLPIAPEFRSSVVQNMQVVLGLAQLVLSFPHSQEVESAQAPQQ